MKRAHRELKWVGKAGLLFVQMAFVGGRCWRLRPHGSIPLILATLGPPVCILSVGSADPDQLRAGLNGVKPSGHDNWRLPLQEMKCTPALGDQQEPHKWSLGVGVCHKGRFDILATLWTQVQQ
jgi:hypothetical protein